MSAGDPLREDFSPKVRDSHALIRYLTQSEFLGWAWPGRQRQQRPRRVGCYPCAHCSSHGTPPLYATQSKRQQKEQPAHSRRQEQANNFFNNKKGLKPLCDSPSPKNSSIPRGPVAAAAAVYIDGHSPPRAAPPVCFWPIRKRGFESPPRSEGFDELIGSADGNEAVILPNNMERHCRINKSAWLTRQTKKLYYIRGV